MSSIWKNTSVLIPFDWKPQTRAEDLRKLCDHQEEVARSSSSRLHHAPSLKLIHSTIDRRIQECTIENTTMRTGQHVKGDGYKGGRAKRATRELMDLATDRDATKAIPEAISTEHGRQHEDLDIKGVLASLLELMESVRNDIEVDCLENAISLLQDALHKEANAEENRTIIIRYLIQAHLTRYGLYGWTEDLDVCLQHLVEIIGSLENPTQQETIDTVPDAQVAAQLIQACRNSFNIYTLSIIVCVATNALSASYANDDWNLDVADLLVILGNALVMKYFCQGGTAELDLATMTFRQAERVCDKDAPLAYICLMSLSHIEWLRLIECGEAEGFARLCDFVERADAADEKGRRLFDAGTKMAEDAVNDTQLQDAVVLLRNSLNNRPAPHPQRLLSLHHLTGALFLLFQKRHGPQDLEECIVHYREKLDLLPVPRAHRSSTLVDLAKAVFARFDHKGAFSDLDESIVLYRDSLDLLPRSDPRRLTALNDLACTLSTRFERKGMLEDLEDCVLFSREALDLHPASNPDRSTMLNNLATALCNRFKRTGLVKDLQECIALFREALVLRVPPHPGRPSLLNNLATSLFTLFGQQGCFQDLEECIVLHQEALNLRPPPHSDCFATLNNLAAAISARFEQKGALQDLDECILLHRKALDLIPASHPSRSLSLNNLATSLSTRFQQKGDDQDLGECIVIYQEALDLRPTPHPNRASSLNNLASALSTRFEREGTLPDIEHSIILLREALSLYPAQHPDRSVVLTNLATGLSKRFAQRGTIKDLDECILLHQESLSLRPPPHPNRPVTLNNLAEALFTRFQQNGVFEDLEESVALHREALDLRPSSHPYRSISLNNLATSLEERFKQRGNLQDLEECIILNQESLVLHPPSHPSRSTFANNLAASLSARFRHQGSLHDLEQCIALYKEVLDLQPNGHPGRSTSLNNLVAALFTRIKHKGLFQDVDECIELSREALSLHPPSHPSRSTSLSNLAASLSARFDHKGISQDLQESIMLYREALGLRPVPHNDHSSSLNNLASALCTRFYDKGLLQDLEESIGLYREALDCQIKSHPERIQYLNNLGCALFTCFKQKGILQDLEECIVYFQEVLELRPAPHPDRSNSLDNLAIALYTRFEHKEALQPGSPRDDTDINDALRYYEEATQYETGSLVLRLVSSKYWATCARKHRPESTLDACTHSIQLLPLLASLDLTLHQRQDVLERSRELVGDAARYAIELNQCEAAVRFLSTGRSIFWSQALQLRTPVDELMITHPELAKRFITVSTQLENASYSNNLHSISDSSPRTPWLSSIDTCTSPHLLATRQRQTIEEIRRIPGHEGFLLPPSFASLQSAAVNGPFVLLNASHLGCDALIMRQAAPVKHIYLSGIRLGELNELKMLVHTLSRAGKRHAAVSQDMVKTAEHLPKRDFVRESSTNSDQDTFRSALERLWIKIVRPVIEALGMEKSNFPRRIWWCPTGLFTSLPLHAAGIYSKDNKPIDCIFQYAINSYCTSPQDLLHSPPSIAKDFKLTAVIEPEAAGAPVLPATLKELEEINKNLPSEQHLIAHIGSRTVPNQPEDLISDIQHSSIVHFGCHGMQNLKNPLESSLLLSGGKLTMSRIIKECRVPEGALGYLSACETAKGDEVRPDESLNLVATMMFAGFRSVVGTIWSIFDDDAPIVAGVFYRHLFRNGKETAPDVRDAAYGLHLALNELRERGMPFHSWVPYVHYGI